MLKSLSVRSIFLRSYRQQVFVLFVLWVALSVRTVMAAPFLVEDGVGEPKREWVNEMPVDFSGFEEGLVSRQEDMPEKLTKRDAVRRVPQAATRLPRNSLFNDIDSIPQNSSLQSLLRTYLNTQATAGSSAMPGQFSPAVEQVVNGRRANDGLDVAGRQVVDDMLTRTFSFVVQPGINDRGLMTFSILGLGEFALVGGNAGVTLSLGDFFSFSIFGTAGDVILPGALMSGLNSDGGAVAAGQASVTDYSAGDGALLKSVANGDADGLVPGGNKGGAGTPSADGVGKVHLSRFIVLLYDIVTYPGTILTLLMLLLLQLIKAGKRLKERRAHRLRIRNHLRSRRELQL